MGKQEHVQICSYVIYAKQICQTSCLDDTELCPANYAPRNEQGETSDKNKMEELKRNTKAPEAV